MINVSHHTIQEEIHRGENTVLYRGLRDEDGAPVVVKLLRSEYPSPSEVAKLRHEHAITRSLALAGVVKVHGMEKYGHGSALVMASAGGRSLDRALRAQPLGLPTALRIAASIAGTLAAIHARGVIHKDIKPHNILFHEDTQATTLIDFGIATRLSHESQRAQGLDSLEGTLAYMSPEQTGRMNRAVDHRTDLYSLGATLYEMLTRRLPFTSQDPLELVHSHIARIPASPRDLSPEVPEVVSAIVMKLLAKAAEDRYQTARGLETDLRECLHQWETTGKIGAFPLGRQDRTGELRIPQKLYGRGAELQALMAAQAGAGAGAALLLVVKGQAGVGKSTLIQELQKTITCDGGHFITGKFGQLNRSMPYAGVGHAFGELCRQIVAERPKALASWKSKLEKAVGQNGRVLVDLIPELALILGPQPEVPLLGPTETQSRFHRVLQAFVRALAGPGRPLVAFFDDLQWADPASLKLIQFLLTDPESANLLVIGAYRDNEVDAAHPLQLALSEIQKNGVLAEEILLGPLSLPDATQLLADTLGCDLPRAEPLAAVVWAKTHGNPFFLGQFLATLEKERLLSFDARSGAWAWDLERIQQMTVTDNVVDFMAGKIQELSPPAAHLLELAACIGHEFDIRTLSILRGKSPGETAAELWEALQQGLVLPLDAEYRFLHLIEEPEAGGPPSTFNVSYRFLHDRVEQAASSRMDDDRRQETHLRLGRLLRATGGGPLGEKELFDVIDHLNLGAARITDPAERLELVRSNLTAGKRAKAAVAYEAAAGYLEAGAALLGASGWAEEYELCFALHADLAECELYGGRPEKAESRLGDLLARASSTVDRARIRALQMVLYITLSRFADSVRAGLAGLRLFGIEMPETEEHGFAALQGELAEVRVNMAGRRVEALIDAPDLVDREQRALQEILMHLVVSARAVLLVMSLVSVVKGVNLTLKHGHSELSAHTYMLYSFALSSGLGAYEEAGAFGDLALALHTKRHEVDQACMLIFLHGAHIHFHKHIGAALPNLVRGYQAGVETGNLLYASYSCNTIVTLKLGLGHDLVALRAEIAQQISFIRRAKIFSSEAVQLVARQMVANLDGRINDRRSLSDDAFDEVEFLAEMERSDLVLVHCWYHTVKAQLAVLYEDPELALSMIAQAERSAHSSSGLYFAVELPFYAGVALLACYSAKAADEQPQCLEAITRRQEELARLAAQCPANYLHKSLLLAAERARIEGKALEAMDLYEQAIAAAQANEFLREEALASELFAKFLYAQGRTRMARAYMSDARHAYQRWGATAKVADLTEKYPDLLHPAAAPPRFGDVRTTIAIPTETTTSTTTSRSGRGDVVDLAAVMQAAQAFAGELVLERLLDRLMRIVVESAGAQRGYLLLARAEQLMIEASIVLDPDKVEVGLSVPAESRADLALHVVQYVARTRETVCLGDAARASRFAADPYIAGGLPRSILCLPLLHQGRLTGVLYLENNRVREAFTSNRIELLGLLSSQAAVAVENALLYADVQRHRATLEVEVGRRTEELSAAKARLELELDERARGEQERAELQEEVIMAQNTRLAELSTPMIPITDRIMVMPLIGMMDAPRAQQVLETALFGAKESRAKVVILDITGMKLVDAAVASVLVSAAGGLRLLGAQVVITGIRPEVAQALVGLDIDLRGLLTLGTLQSGIAHALRLTGGDARRWH